MAVIRNQGHKVTVKSSNVLEAANDSNGYRPGRKEMIPQIIGAIRPTRAQYRMNLRQPMPSLFKTCLRFQSYQSWAFAYVPWHPGSARCDFHTRGQLQIAA